MNISEEFSKIRFSFSKVKYEMDILIDKISSNYDDFLTHHKKLSGEVEDLSSKVKLVLEKLNDPKSNHLNHFNSTELNELKLEIKLLKEEVMHSEKKHSNISLVLEDVKKNKKDLKDLKTKLKSSELEIYLLKENLVQKDVEIKQIKEISRHLFNVVEELSKTELSLVNRSRIK